MASAPQSQTKASVQKKTAATTQPAKTSASDAIVVEINLPPQPDTTSASSTAGVSGGSSQPTASATASKTTPQSKDQTAAPPAPAASGKSQAIKDKALRKARGARGFFKRAPTVVGIRAEGAEANRLQEDKDRTKNWKRWGPYLSERQWATVREDYSPDGSW